MTKTRKEKLEAIAVQCLQGILVNNSQYHPEDVAEIAVSYAIALMKNLDNVELPEGQAEELPPSLRIDP